MQCQTNFLKHIKGMLISQDWNCVHVDCVSCELCVQCVHASLFQLFMVCLLAFKLSFFDKCRCCNAIIILGV